MGARGARVFMVVSALFLAACGVATLFTPRAVLGMHGTVPDGPTVLLVQMMGALYLGFALINWRVRGAMADGPVAGPVAAGNFLHFGAVAIMLGAEAIDHRALPLAISAAVFGAYAVGFFGLIRGRAGGAPPTVEPD